MFNLLQVTVQTRTLSAFLIVKEQTFSLKKALDKSFNLSKAFIHVGHLFFIT